MKNIGGQRPKIGSNWLLTDHYLQCCLGQTRLTEDTKKIVVKFINVLNDWKVPINKMDLHAFAKT